MSRKDRLIMKRHIELDQAARELNEGLFLIGNKYTLSHAEETKILADRIAIVAKMAFVEAR